MNECVEYVWMNEWMNESMYEGSCSQKLAYFCCAMLDLEPN